MAEKVSDVDQFDRKILDILTVEGRISVTELARRIGLSKSPTQARLKRLEECGVIRGYRALYDPIRLGRDHVAFVEVKLTDTREAALSAFNAAVMRVPEIEQCHLIAGAFDYLLKVRTAGMTGYRCIGRKNFDLTACGEYLDLCGDAGGERRRLGADLACDSWVT